MIMGTTYILYGGIVVIGLLVMALLFATMEVTYSIYGSIAIGLFIMALLVDRGREKKN
jgi:hypothetical protein